VLGNENLTLQRICCETTALHDSETPATPVARFERFETPTTIRTCCLAGHVCKPPCGHVFKHDVDIAASDAGTDGDRHRSQHPWQWLRIRHQSCEEARTAGDSCLPAAPAVTTFTSRAKSMMTAHLKKFWLSAFGCKASCKHVCRHSCFLLAKL